MMKLMESIYSRKGNGVHMRKLKGMFLLIVPLFVVMVVQINHASAVTFSGTVYTDETAFTTAAGGGLTTEDFNSFTSDISFSSPLGVDVGDFTLSMTGSDLTTVDYNKIDAFDPTLHSSVFDIDGSTVAQTSVGWESTDNQFHITFDSTINWLGFETAALNDNVHRTDVLIDGELVTLSAVTGDQIGYLGFFSAGGFTDITFLRVALSDGFAIDNLQYKGGDPIPEPATVTFLGLGLAGLAFGAARRKWKKKAVDKS